MNVGITDIEVDYSTPLLPGDEVDVFVTLENTGDETVDGWLIEVTVNGDVVSSYESLSGTDPLLPPEGTWTNNFGSELRFDVPSGTYGEELTICAEVSDVSVQDDVDPPGTI